jgi:hypothetical protein
MIAAWGGSEDAAWGSRSSARWLPVWVFLVGACFTACVYLLPGDMFDVAYRSVSLRVASEAFGSLAGLAFAYLVVGRARGGPCLADYLVAAAFIVAAVENIVFLAFPTAHNYGYTSGFSAWSSSGARVVEAALFATASFAPRRQLPIGRRAALAWTLVGAGAVCLAISMAVLAAGRHLPPAIDQSLSPVARGTVLPAGSGGIALLALASAVLFAVAAVRMSVGAQTNDPLGRWLAVGLVTAALAACNFALFPTEYSQWVDVGDILQFAFSLAGACQVG